MRIFNRPFTALCVIAAAVMLGTLTYFAVRAAGPVMAFEPETGSMSGQALVQAASDASNGQAVKFGTGTTGLNLPAPINPGDRNFGRIVRQTAPNGGVVVLPDGDYTVSDVTNFNPSNYVVIVAQNPLQAHVVRTANVVGETDQLFSGSSKLIFVGVDFKDIVTAVSGGSDIYFWHTRHSYPVRSHPVPTETFCGNRTGPDGVDISNATRVGLFGSVIDGAGHDALKLNNADNLIFRGSKITKVDHENLQQGRGNSRCGWDGNDNYHDDGIQIYPGGVDNLLIENSYIGRHGMIQVDTNGSSNNNLTFRNNTFYEEPPHTSCLAMDARVKPAAQAGAVQTMTLQSNDAWCADSQWILHVAGSRDRAMTINGTQILSTDREANRFLTRRTGAPNTANTPSEAWRIANPINTWPCYLQANVSGFTQNLVNCSN